MRVEAEDGRLVAPMVRASEAGASNGWYVHTPPDQYGGEDLIDFTIPIDGIYVIWGRAWGIGWGNDSFWVSMDSGSEANWAIPHDRWQWDLVDNLVGGTTVPITYSLSAGRHQLRVRTREHGSRLDVVDITNDLGFQP